MRLSRLARVTKSRALLSTPSAPAAFTHHEHTEFTMAIRAIVATTYHRWAVDINFTRAGHQSVFRYLRGCREKLTCQPCNHHRGNLPNTYRLFMNVFSPCCSASLGLALGHLRRDTAVRYTLNPSGLSRTIDHICEAAFRWGRLMLLHRRQAENMIG